MSKIFEVREGVGLWNNSSPRPPRVSDGALAQPSTSTSTSTLFHKTIGYNRLARKIAIANRGGPVKRKINWKEKKGKEKEGKTTILSYNK